MHPDQATEQARADAYVLSCASRKAYIAARARALAPTMGADVADAWRPLVLALADQDGPCDNVARDVAQLAQVTSETA
jgi:hypothetical protein